MQAGKLDERVAIYRKNVTGQNTDGGDVIGTPTTIGTFWTEVQFGQGKELQAAQQRWAEVTITFLIRRQPGLAYTIEPSDYAEWNGQTWDVVGVLGQGTRSPYWTIAAKDFIE